jgi:hypothetical protein
MWRITAASLAACLLLETLIPAARAHAQAAEPFQVVPIATPAHRGHTWAYVSLLGGAGLIGVSFAFARRADDAYDEYLVTTDLERIDLLYDRAVRNDHLSHASLLTGEALIATGLYLRFIRRPPAARVSLSVEPSRCALSYRF